MRLSEYVRIQAMRSNIDVTCTVNPRHVSKTYYQFTVEVPHAVLEAFQANTVLPKPQLDMYVCPVCMIEFMGDAHKQIEGLAALT